MAKTIVRNQLVEFNGSDISNHVDMVTIEAKYEVKDVSGLGTVFKEKLLGQADATIKISGFQDMAGGSVDDLFSAVAGSNTPFPVVVTDTDSGKTWTMNSLLPVYQALNAKVGEPSAFDVTLECGDQLGIVAA